MVRTDYSREELIELCERGRVPQERWSDRDTAKAQMQLGEAWVLLAAGCEFRVLGTDPKDDLATDEETVWLEIKYRGFNWFENGDEDDLTSTNSTYLPTPKRLSEVAGGDWY